MLDSQQGLSDHKRKAVVVSLISVSSNAPSAQGSGGVGSRIIDYPLSKQLGLVVEGSDKYLKSSIVDSVVSCTNAFSMSILILIIIKIDEK